MDNFNLTTGKKWIICLLIALATTVLMYNPESYQWNMYWFLTLFAIACFAFEPIPNPITATMLMLSYVTFKVAPGNIVFTGWTGFLPWMVFAATCIGAVVEKTGLSRRLALLVMDKVAKTPLLLFMAFLIAGYTMNFFIAAIFPSLIVLCAFGISVCNALNLKKDSKAATCIMLAVYMAVSNVGVNFLPNNMGLAAVQMLENQGFTTNWSEFFIDNLSLSFFSALVSLLILYFYSRSEIEEKMGDLRECVEGECQELEPISKDEIKAFALLLLAVCAFIFQPYHGLPGVFLMALILFLSFCPPFNLLDKEDFAKFNFGIIIFIVGCLSIGFTAASLGVPAWFSGKLLPVVENMDSAASMSVFAYFIAVLANFVLTPLAAASSLSAPLADLAIQVGISAKPVIYSFLLGVDQWLLPYEAAPALFLYASGYMRLKHIIVIMTIRMLLLAVVVWLNTITIWNFMGI